MTELWTQEILRTRQKVKQARIELRGQRLDGEYPPKAKKQFGHVLLEYYDTLSEFRTNNKIEDEWQQSGVDDLPEYFNRQVVVEHQAPGFQSGIIKETKPQVEVMDGDRLIHLSKQLDNFANELGFTADTQENLPTDKI